MTWKQGGWPHSEIRRLVDEFQSSGEVTESWRIHAHKQSAVGDNVWLLKQGRGAKGIFATGVITGRPALADIGTGKQQMTVPIRFNAIVDPLEQMLISEDDVREILDEKQIHAQASGTTLEDAQSEKLQERLDTSGPHDLSGSGDWTPREIQAVTEDYFDMLVKELRGETYSKTKHREALSERVTRNKGSIEYKHQNISAVLQELGYPRVAGYKPASNYQESLRKAIEGELSNRVELIDQTLPEQSPEDLDVESLFVDLPSPPNTVSSKKSGLRGPSKFDPAARDNRNRILGKAGEKFVLEVEEKRLREAGRPDLAKKVRWTADIDGDGAGYDIQSFDNNGAQIFIEVKTTRGGKSTKFFLTRNELSVSREFGSRYLLYRLFDFANSPRIFVVEGPLDARLELEPATYRASVSGESN